MSNYSKERLASSFVEEYKNLTESQKEVFSKACFKLLNENYIYGQKKDEKELYYSIDTYRQIIQNYFNIIDYELAHDGVYKIFYLKSSSERPSLKLKKMESVILLLLRKFYYVKSKETNSDVNISVTYDELLEDMYKTGIYNDRLRKTEIENSLLILKKYKIINFDNKSYSSSDALTIYPTVLYAVAEDDLKNLQIILNGYGAKEEVVTDETEED